MEIIFRRTISCLAGCKTFYIYWITSLRLTALHCEVPGNSPLETVKLPYPLSALQPVTYDVQSPVSAAIEKRCSEPRLYLNQIKLKPRL
jgi:hypothetical protein